MSSAEFLTCPCPFRGMGLHCRRRENRRPARRSPGTSLTGRSLILANIDRDSALLFWLGERFADVYGPLRLLTSYLFLAVLGTAMAGFFTWRLLPRLWTRLPRDRGRAYAVENEQSHGKPVGAGIIFIPIYVAVCILVLPPGSRYWQILGCVLLAMVAGFLDDRSPGGWGEYRVGAIDLGISLLGAMVICQLEPVQLWLPLMKTPVSVPPWIFVPGAALLIWVSINATNCTDGVDGLSGSLSVMAFVYLATILYGIVGHRDIARYLLVPHYPDGAVWALFAFIMAGCLAGYLWYNAYPSSVLMGDAGSRPMGFLLGILVLACGQSVSDRRRRRRGSGERRHRAPEGCVSAVFENRDIQDGPLSAARSLPAQERVVEYARTRAVHSAPGVRNADSAGSAGQDSIVIGPRSALIESGGGNAAFIRQFEAIARIKFKIHISPNSLPPAGSF